MALFSELSLKSDMLPLEEEKKVYSPTSDVYSLQFPSAITQQSVTVIPPGILWTIIPDEEGAVL